MNEETEAHVSSNKRTALLRYLAILFAVAFALVLLSYLIQVFNSQNTISQLNATSASALQNAERLQDTNRELTEENERLEKELINARTAILEYQESVAAARENAMDEGRTQGLSEGRGETQRAYDLLITALTSEDSARRDQALQSLAGLEAALSEPARQQLAALRGRIEAEQTEKP